MLETVIEFLQELKSRWDLFRFHTIRANRRQRWELIQYDRWLKTSGLKEEGR